MGRLRFEVRGVLLDVKAGQPMVGYSVIAETGVRDEASPLCLDSIKPGEPPTDRSGRFNRTFFSRGASFGDAETLPVPGFIEVHIEFIPGKWRCRVVAVNPNAVTFGNDNEAVIDLGNIPVDYDNCRLPKGDKDNRPGFATRVD